MVAIHMGLSRSTPLIMIGHRKATLSILFGGPRRNRLSPFMGVFGEAICMMERMAYLYRIRKLARRGLFNCSNQSYLDVFELRVMSKAGNRWLGLMIRESSSETHFCGVFR